MRVPQTHRGEQDLASQRGLARINVADKHQVEVLPAGEEAGGSMHT